MSEAIKHTTLAELLMGIVLAVLIIGATAILEAFILIKLWGWFVIPTFDMPALTYPCAIGLITLANLIQHTPPTEEPKEVFKRAFIKWFLAFSIGWVAHLFM